MSAKILSLRKAQIAIFKRDLAEHFDWELRDCPILEDEIEFLFDLNRFYYKPVDGVYLLTSAQAGIIERMQELDIIRDDFNFRIQDTEGR